MLDEAFHEVLIQNERKKVFYKVDKDGTGKLEHYICKFCKDAFLRNKMPSRCILNECRMAYQPDCLKTMTAMESVLIAQNLHFIKIYCMPRSRWAQLRDRVINVPVSCGNVKKQLKVCLGIRQIQD